MQKLISLLREVDESELVRRVTGPLDEVRNKIELRSNTVADTAELDRIIGEVVQRAHADVLTPGGTMPIAMASVRGKQILENVLRRRRQTIQNVVANAKDGLNGGMRQIVDDVIEGLKAESIESYIESVFDKYIDVDSWSERVSIIRELMEHFEYALSESIRARSPESFAASYKDLLRPIIETVRESGASFRRI